MTDQSDLINGHCVLDIDGDWTAHKPSGVDLVQRKAEGWQCLALASSYDAFLAMSTGEPWDQSQKAQGENPIPSLCWRPANNWRGNPWTACR